MVPCSNNSNNNSNICNHNSTIVGKCNHIFFVKTKLYIPEAVIGTAVVASSVVAAAVVPSKVVPFNNIRSIYISGDFL